MTDRTEAKPAKRVKEKAPVAGGRDDRLEEELDRERREPGLSSGGKGDAGADPGDAKSDGNSNT